jgi:hypothetical protein
MSSSISNLTLIVCILLSGAAFQPGEATAKKLDRCWDELASPDAKAAFQAMGEMMELPKETVVLMAGKLQPVPTVEISIIEKLVGELDSDTFNLRQKATKELERLAGQARPALEKMLAKPPSAEAQSRAKKLLEQLDGPVTSPDELRIIRAVEVLERIGSPEARELLAKLAKGATAARLTVEAAGSLARLK